MEASQNSYPSGTPSTKPPVSHRVWTWTKEEALIDALKELVANGWKADNGFRRRLPRSFRMPGYRGLNTLTLNSRSRKKHITKCGFGFNSAVNMVKVPSDSVWDDYVRVHPDVFGFQNKCFPYYDDWIEIFVRDKATGQEAQQIEDAILELKHPHKVYDEVMDEHTMFRAKGKPSKFTTINLDDVVDSDDVFVIAGNGVANSSKGKAAQVRNGGKKRKQTKVMNIPEGFVKVSETFFNTANQSFEGLEQRIAPVLQPASWSSTSQSTTNKTKQVFELVEKITDLPAELRVRLSHKIVSSAHNTELLLNMDEKCQNAFVHLLLQDIID